MLVIPPDEALEVLVDELALVVLACLVAASEWNEYNHVNLTGRTSRAAPAAARLPCRQPVRR
jgi:hypothetical protein